MARARERVLFAWSGGKESMLALAELRRGHDVDPAGLVTVLVEGDERLPLRGVPGTLAVAQAEALGLPIELIAVPRGATQRERMIRLARQLAPYATGGLTKVAFGDVFQDELRDLREECLEAVGLEAIFPLWGRCTTDLAETFLRHRCRAVVTCVDEQCLDASMVGRSFDRGFLRDLPLAADPCGENGEFRTFVHEGPGFAHPIAFRAGPRYIEHPLHFCNMIAGSGAAAAVARAAARGRS